MENSEMFSVKWYEPFTSGKNETVKFVGSDGKFITANIPATRGWHEQSVIGKNTAQSLCLALRSKGFELVKYKRSK